MNARVGIGCAVGGTERRRTGGADTDHFWRNSTLPIHPRRTFMTILSGLNVIRLCALGLLLILPATSGARQRPPIFENLAKTYGLESFGQIDAIRYTFNAEAPGFNVSRTWAWEPKTDEVTYEGKDKSGNPVTRDKRRIQAGRQPSAITFASWPLGNARNLKGSCGAALCSVAGWNCRSQPSL
jgi:hypothetical protein